MFADVCCYPAWSGAICALYPCGGEKNLLGDQLFREWTFLCMYVCLFVCLFVGHKTRNPAKIDKPNKLVHGPACDKQEKQSRRADKQARYALQSK